MTTPPMPDTASPYDPLDVFLLTRFCVRLESGTSLPNPAWVEERFTLFETVCIPSVAAQTSEDFEWLVFVDSGVAQDVQDRVRSAIGTLGEVVVIDQPCTQGIVSDLVTARRTRPVVATVRFDSDDALARTFVAKVREHKAVDGTEFLNFLRGYQWSRGRLLRYRHPSNPFVVMYERTMAAKTIFVTWHDNISSYGSVHQSKEGPMWIQVIHGGNVANRERGLPARRPDGQASFSTGLVVRRQGTLAWFTDLAFSSIRLGVYLLRKPGKILRVARASAPNAG